VNARARFYWPGSIGPRSRHIGVRKWAAVTLKARVNALLGMRPVKAARNRGISA